MRDPYKTLGVSRTASDDEIKAAYRKLAKKFHPDANRGNDESGSKDSDQRFRDIGSAYGVVGDTAKRAKFDRGEIDADGKERADFAYQRAWGSRGQRGANPFRSRQAHPGQAGPGGQGGAGFEGHDIFDDLFGRGAGMRGTDVTYELTIEFLDAAKGGRRDLVLSDGRIVNVSIPSGAENGQTLRLRGQGMAGMRGGKAGDAMIRLVVSPHAFFERKDGDIHLTVPITLKEAVLGASIEVPTIDGKVAVKVPANSSSGTSLRLKGKGVSARGGDRGAQLIHLEIVLGDKTDDALQSFVEGWEPAKQDPRAKRGLV